MTTHIKVYPTKASALNVHHPVGGRPHSEGVLWPYDVFTCRRLTDGSFTEDASQAHKPAPAVENADPGKAAPAPNNEPAPVAAVAAAKAQESTDPKSK